MKELTLKEIQNLLGYEVKIVADKPQKQLSDVPVGDTFKIGNLEFIVLKQAEDETHVILRDFWKREKFDDETNNFAKSSVREELNVNFYNQLISLVGKDNILRYSVNLTSDDGRKDYGYDSCYVSLLTCDQYREYVDILDKYRPDEWWWLATPYSTESNGYSYSVRCVNSCGALYYGYCNYDNGVRPFCIFRSSIFVS